ncbi:1-phosphofructokinase [Weissella uvarum]|uniref:1-phosphofructokinase n=1 Tax=Weissella uvarum TaxID=1479233 RepID=UPI001960F5C8|nr:1-phosphofructokinase [Weissella uvarum]MBM7616922.1 1-phosphofructokinase [Weissella uvarum]MCM0594627.1 1-phosphofructokinase [Weissella uvarum]
MIYTVTLNPSIDYIVQVDDLQLGETNRAKSTTFFPGGKGINVSRLLNQQGIPSTMWGFLGNFTGDFILKNLENEAMQADFTPVSAPSRINIKIKADQETEINGGGPEITAAELADFKAKFEQLTDADVVILSGSIPTGVAPEIYHELIDQIQAHGANFVIDTTGAALAQALPKHPLLVKPNRDEIAELYQTPVDSLATLKAAGHRLLADGAQNAIISMAGDGALLFTPAGDYFAPAIKGQVVNSVGAGDSMIAGFVGEWLKQRDAVESFKHAVASGSGTAFSADIAKKEMIEKMLTQVEIQALD